MAVASPLDRVKEIATTTGTGTFTLAGAAFTFRSFSAVGTGNSTPYTIVNLAADEWEVGIGTYTSAGTTLSRDRVLASSNAGAAVNFSAGRKEVFLTMPASQLLVPIEEPGGRLTLTTGTPVTSSDVTNATLIYYTPYKHNRITLWDGNSWQRLTFAELSAAPPAHYGLNVDVFASISGGAVVLQTVEWNSNSNGAVTGATNATPIVITSTAHGLSNDMIVDIRNVLGNTAANGIFRVAAVAANTFSLNTLAGVSVAGSGAYTSGGTWQRLDQNTTRATALTQLDGVYVASGLPTLRYLGTVRPFSNAGTTGLTDSLVRRGVWNMYNRVPRKLRVVEATASWTYATAAMRPANNSLSNRVEAVVGIAGESIVRLQTAAYATSSSNNESSTGIGINSVGTNGSDLLGFVVGAPAFGPAQSLLEDIAAAGYTYYQWLEYAAAATSTFFGTSGNLKGGMLGHLMA